MSGIVESCPANSTEITKASSNLNCSRDKYGNDQYICVPNVNKTALVEFCNNGIMGIVEKGNCLEVSEGELVKRSCTGFVEGCPEIHYGRNEIYRYPACQRINTDYKCYLADPSCPNKTRQFTTEDTWGSSTASFMTSFEFSNTTEKGVYTTLPTNAGSVGAIVGGLVAGVVIIGIGIVLTVIGFIVWKRRKKQRKKQRRTGNTEEAEVELLERRHSRPSDDDIGERQNLANLQNESGSLVNNAAGVSEFTLTDEERRHSLHVDDDIRERKNLGNQENGSEPLLNNAAGISESEHLLKQVSDDDPPTLKREDKSTRDDGAMSMKEWMIQGNILIYLTVSCTCPFV
ncbi:uncharacterized protein LOC125676217 isoform X2 [Ostrea edulis]|uniref:uncharacterized protein LOC125676217 isoform X2 n=1 Tax=Ostrea edulis TaxID=37623 RepID=UPI0024AED2B1|nr:uncharacterized protein LOC125676217 isoform X2 [Ostrea edulis]